VYILHLTAKCMNMFVAGGYKYWWLLTLQCVNNLVSRSKVYEWVEKLDRCTS